MAMIGDLVHFTLPNGRCRPALIVECGAALAATSAREQAEAKLAEASAELDKAQAALTPAAAALKSMVAVGANGKGSVASMVTTEQAQAVLSASQAHDGALRFRDEAQAQVEQARSRVNAAKAAQVAAVDVYDLQVFTAGMADATQVEMYQPSVHENAIVQPSVARSAVKHDAKSHAPGTWHTREEES
jgi:multidrug efflux pump subunit AcrA (membrane-fusion protein)